MLHNKSIINPNNNNNNICGIKYLYFSRYCMEVPVACQHYSTVC